MSQHTVDCSYFYAIFSTYSCSKVHERMGIVQSVYLFKNMHSSKQKY